MSEMWLYLLLISLVGMNIIVWKEAFRLKKKAKQIKEINELNNLWKKS